MTLAHCSFMNATSTMLSTLSLNSISSILSQGLLLKAIVILLASFLSYVFINEIIRYRARNPYFTGPGGLPIIGNIRDIRFHAPSKLQEWAKQYGDVYQIQLGNVPILVVNGASAAKELIGGNAHAVSSRPEFYTFHKVLSSLLGSNFQAAHTAFRS